MQLRDILAAFYDTYKNGKEINYKIEFSCFYNLAIHNGQKCPLNISSLNFPNQ